MEQRRLRLGDILDDYCPRERRVTNHAIVAMIEEDVKQTRCTTCDAEHAYKGARVPKRRKKDAIVAPLERAPAEVQVPDVNVDPSDHAEASDAHDDDVAASAPESESPEQAPEAEPVEPEPVEDGPVHRPLIRATLPRPEGQKDARPLPEFTIRQNGGRGGNNQFRGDRMKMRAANAMGGNGNRPHGGSRFQGGRPGGGRGPAGRGGPQTGFRGGQQRHGGKKGRGGSRG